MAASSDYPSTVCFAVHAEADPSVMSRVLEEFAKRGLVPLRWHGSRGGYGGRELTIDIQLEGLDAALTTRIAAVLRQQHRVHQVLTTERRMAEVA